MWPSRTKTGCHTSPKTQLHFPSTWPATADCSPNRANALRPTSTSDLREAHVSLNIAKGRGRWPRVKPAALFIIFLHDLWPTGRGRTVAFENSTALFWMRWGEKQRGSILFLCGGKKKSSALQKHVNKIPKIAEITEKIISAIQFVLNILRNHGHFLQKAEALSLCSHTTKIYTVTEQH